MPKALHHLRKSLPPADLFLQDIHDIYNFLESECKKVWIVLRYENITYRLDNPEEITSISSKKGYFNDLNFYGTFEDDSFSINVHCGKPAAINLEADDNFIKRWRIETIESIFKERANKWRRFVTSPLFYSILCFLWTAAIISITELKFGNVPAGSIFLSFLSGVTFAIVIGSLPIPSTLIYPYNKSDRPSFWKRKKDDLILVLIGAVCTIIGSLITYIILR